MIWIKSWIFLEFEVGFDIDKALVDIKQGVEEIKYQLPQEAEDPQIQEYSEASFPVMNISIVVIPSDTIVIP